MTEVKFTSEIPVELVKTDFSDEWPCFAAWTSTRGDEATPEVKRGLINRLMADKHGSVFEHCNITFRVTAPLFVWREHHRHRIGFSYNEESGRYKVLNPLFYSPDLERPLQTVQGSKQMDYVYAPGTDEQVALMYTTEKQVCQLAYDVYERRLAAGIIKEIARKDLPLSVMSTCVVTTNPRALMNFIALRTRDERARFPSKPQIEIEMVARQYEQLFAQAAPMTYQAFNDNGRVAP